MSTEGPSTRRLLAFTGARSDYDLMSGLYCKLHADPELHLGLIVAGAHLSPAYGYTVQYIERDKLPIVGRIASLNDSDRPAARLQSAATLLQESIKVTEEFAPDALLFAGDREDVIVGALVGAYLGIPTVHFYGGDHASDGNVDNPVRHATSKLASLHFVAAEQHKERLQRLGEPESRIFVVGSPALDKFRMTPWLSRRDLLATLGRPEWARYALVIFHPDLANHRLAGQQFAQVLDALEAEKMPAFVSYPNTDAGNYAIISSIEARRGSPTFHFYQNLDRVTFVNLMRHAALMLGNSSAGLYEAPSIPLAAVNVGQRQRGRLAAANVVFVDAEASQVREAIQRTSSEPFQRLLQGVRSPYGDGHSVDRAHTLLKTLALEPFRYKCEDPLR